MDLSTAQNSFDLNNNESEWIDLLFDVRHTHEHTFVDQYQRKFRMPKGSTFINAFELLIPVFYTQDYGHVQIVDCQRGQKLHYDDQMESGNYAIWFFNSEVKATKAMDNNSPLSYGPSTSTLLLVALIFLGLAVSFVQYKKLKDVHELQMHRFEMFLNKFQLPLNEKQALKDEMQQLKQPTEESIVDLREILLSFYNIVNRPMLVSFNLLCAQLRETSANLIVVYIWGFSISYLLITFLQCRSGETLTLREKLLRMHKIIGALCLVLLLFLGLLILILAINPRFFA
ncbi:hypothetical protein M3Y95_00389900 [Aphelenchoides besseyi]|nr:hypothetical protein M3Y95_00389900 [Aphelenchoides besseyi]